MHNEAVEYRSARWEDLGPINELSNAIAVADDTDEFAEVEDRREEWEAKTFDHERDLQVAVAASGAVAGWVEVRVASSPRDGAVRAYLPGGVGVQWRGTGIGEALLAWGRRRALAKAQEVHPGVPVIVSVWGREETSDAAQLLRELGYSPARYFSDMQVSLDGWVPPSLHSVEVEVRAPQDDDSEAVRLAHNDAFRDHWGSSESTQERWSESWERRVTRRPLSRIAVDQSTGDVLAYVLAEHWVEGELYVSLVGARRSARGAGLASALLSEVVLGAQKAGYAKVSLGVDAASPTGANGVYERIGFTTVRTGVSMEAPPAGGGTP